MISPRRFIAGLVVVTVAVMLGGALISAPASALTASEVQQRLQDARSKITAAKKKRASLSEQIRRLDGRLKEIQAKLDGLGDQIAVVEQKLTVTRDKLAVLREQLRLKKAELARAEAKLRREETLFAERAVLSYKSDDLSYLDVVLASSSFEELISRMNLVHELLSGNKTMVSDIEAARDKVDREKRAIAAREGEVADAADALQKQSDELTALRAAQAASRAAALAVRSDKAGALKSVNKDLAELERQENQLLAESRALTGVIAASTGGGSGGGSLGWPVAGPVVSSFGWRIHPILGYRKFHTGIDIAAGYGAAIHAAGSGRVIYATWMGGYGNVIIIDHGNGLSTLYAHQSSLAVGVGASVRRGQTIGAVGSTGFSTGPHLHFEVRVNGNPVDPMGYL